MATVTATRPPRQHTAPRQRKPLLPVAVTGRFIGGASRQDVLDGSAVLSIISGDDTDRDEMAYWTKALYSGERCTGFRLTKFNTGEVYDVPRSLDACDCPDATYRSERPGGCRHQQALRQALPTVGKVSVPVVAAAAALPVIDRKTQRDEATMPDVSDDSRTIDLSAAAAALPPDVHCCLCGAPCSAAYADYAGETVCLPCDHARYDLDGDDASDTA